MFLSIAGSCCMSEGRCLEVHAFPSLAGWCLEVRVLPFPSACISFVSLEVAFPNCFPFRACKQCPREGFWKCICFLSLSGPGVKRPVAEMLREAPMIQKQHGFIPQGCVNIQVPPLRKHDLRGSPLRKHDLRGSSLCMISEVPPLRKHDFRGSSLEKA